MNCVSNSTFVHHHTYFTPNLWWYRYWILLCRHFSTFFVVLSWHTLQYFMCFIICCLIIWNRYLWFTVANTYRKISLYYFMVDMLHVLLKTELWCVNINPRHMHRGAFDLSLPKCANCALDVRLVVSPSCTALIKEFCQSNDMTTSTFLSANKNKKVLQFTYCTYLYEIWSNFNFYYITFYKIHTYLITIGYFLVQYALFVIIIIILGLVSVSIFVSKCNFQIFPIVHRWLKPSYQCFINFNEFFIHPEHFLFK